MWSRRIALSPLLAVAIGLAGRAAAEPPEPRLAVIVGKESPVHTLTLDVVRDVYLRRRRLWPDGTRVMPVNLPADSPDRRRFSQSVLGRLPSELVDYWNRLYFDGIRPPLVLRTPEAVLAYLAAEPAAVGYVPADLVDVARHRVILILPQNDEP